MDKNFEFTIPEFQIEAKLLQESDLEWARQMRNTDSTRLFLGDSSIISSQEQQKWFSDLQTNTKSCRLIIWQNNQRIGIIRLDFIDRQNNSICIGMDIAEEFRGKGLAKITYKQLIPHLFSIGFHRLWLFVLAFNNIAIRLYQDLGFTLEGSQRQAIYRSGCYYDYLMMSRLSSDKYA
jgi:RimJ/RimL family protein N-acetyltransferase